jgi:hypothetical protein
MISRLKDAYSRLNQVSEMFDEDIDEIDFHSMEKNGVQFQFPYDEQECNFSCEDFINIVNEAVNLKAELNGRVETPSFTYQLISAYGQRELIFLDSISPLKQAIQDGISISIQNAPFIVGCAALKLDAYDSDLFPPLSSYNAIEIKYADKSLRLDDALEINLIKSFLFELADTHNLLFESSEFVFIDQDQHDTFEVQNSFKDLKIRPMELHNEGINLYLSALQISDPKLKLLCFFKVIEYFSPIVLNIDSYNLLRKRLDSPKVLSPDAAYLKSIFELADSADDRRNEREMTKQVLSECIDIVSINELLPQSIRKPVSENMTPSERDKYLRTIAETLVSTRNAVAHAKSNYKLVGTECQDTDIPQLNDFLKSATAQAIRWYNRLPDHSRLTF